MSIGPEVPRPTKSVLVVKKTNPVRLVVQPPPDDAPPDVIVPQVTFPFASVCRAWLPVQDGTFDTFSDPAEIPLDTFKFVDVTLTNEPFVPFKFVNPSRAAKKLVEVALPKIPAVMLA